MSDPRKGNWTTPDGLYQHLNSVYEYDLDAAASAENAKCERFFTEEQDALKQKWGGRVFCNPPYGLKKPLPQTEDWVKYGYLQVREGHSTLVTELIPFKADTNFIHDYTLSGNLIAEAPFVDYREKVGRFSRRFLPGTNLVTDLWLYRQRVEFGGSGGTGWFASAAVTWFIAKSMDDVLGQFVAPFVKNMNSCLLAASEITKKSA